MVHYVHGWYHSAPPPAGHQQGSSIVSDTIIGLALSALALFTASAFDHSAPGFATLLRCVPVGITLVWLFKRFYPSGNGNVHHHMHAVPAPVIHVAPVPTYSNQNYWYGWPNWFKTNNLHPAPVRRPKVHRVQPARNARRAPAQGFPAPSHFPKVRPAPAQRNFQPVYRAPAQTGSHPMHSASHNHPGNTRPMFPVATHR